ncbi:hypothetical protein AGMMS50268_40720 [Spirochaetia bacterium]|nr:hypothetical protein AGMMS50268_40720 [Spirochaetia bacterium]
MQHIVLITRENSEQVTHASVYLCNTLDEAALFCRFINKLELKDNDKLSARRILMNKEYHLEKTEPFSYEDLVKIDDRSIQRIMRDVDSFALAAALSGSSEEIKNKIFRNMSRRAGAMLKEDIELGGLRDEDDVALAKQMVVEAYLSEKALSEKEYNYGSTVTEYGNREKDAEGDLLWKDYDRKKLSIVFVLSGKEDKPENILVTLFDSEEEAYNYREYINNMKTQDDSFYYARLIEQMVEYEIEKPILVRFEKIFDFNESVLAKALIKVNDGTVVKVLQGADAHARERIMNNLPPKLADAVRETFDMQNKYPGEVHFGGTWSIKRAQDAIINVMNSVYKKMKKNGDFGLGVVVIVKD